MRGREETGKLGGETLIFLETVLTESYHETITFSVINHIDTEITKMLKVICSIKKFLLVLELGWEISKLSPPPLIMDEHVKTLAREDTDILTETKE